MLHNAVRLISKRELTNEQQKYIIKLNLKFVELYWFLYFAIRLKCQLFTFGNFQKTHFILFHLQILNQILIEKNMIFIKWKTKIMKKKITKRTTEKPKMIKRNIGHACNTIYNMNKRPQRWQATFKFGFSHSLYNIVRIVINASSSSLYFFISFQTCIYLFYIWKKVAV